jgi:WD40 repeat protein
MTILAAALVVGPTVQKPITNSVNISFASVIQGLHPIAFAPAPTGSRFIACMEDGSVRIMDAKNHSTVRILAKHPQPAYAAAWSPDGTYVATGDESARIWIESPITGEKIREYRTHTKGIQKLSFNLTRQYLISTGKDDQINVYDLASNSPKETQRILGKGANFYGATFDPKLPYTISTGILGPGGRTYDSNSGKVTGFLVTEDHQGVNDVTYNPSGTREVTCGRDGHALVWDVKSLKKIGTLSGHQDWVMVAAYSPNGKLIATSSTDHTVKIWNSNTCQKVADIASQSYVGSPVCFTGDGNALITVDDQNNLQINSVSPSQAFVEPPSKHAPVKVKKAKKHRKHSG